MTGYFKEKNNLKTTYGTETLSKKEIHYQLPSRSINHAILEDFSVPTGWTGTADTINAELSRSITGTNGAQVSMSKNYGTPLVIRNYLIMPIYVSDINKMDFSGIYLLDSTNQTFNISLKIQLKTGYNLLILNKNEFIATVGTPVWENLQTIQFSAKASAGNNLTFKVGKIETYDMNPLCTITFDDGHATHYANAFPYMNAKTPPILASNAIITDFIDTPNYLTQSQVRELIRAGWDIQNHTKNHLNLSTLTLKEAEYQLSRATEYLVSIGAGKGAFQIIPPFYGRNADVDKIIKKYATIQKYCDNKYNKLPILNPYGINTFNVTKDTTVATVKGWIDVAIANDLWVALTFHMINDTYADYMYLNTNFQQIIDYLDVNKASIKTVTMSQALYRS